MDRRWDHETPHELVARVEALLASGIPAARLRTHTPFWVHELDALLPESRPGLLRRFTLGGALAGFLLGILFPVLTVLQWPLPTGGKPLITLPAFLIIGFELTILLGAIASFAGFLILARLPDAGALRECGETGNRFVVIDLGGGDEA
jgi:hypothetical protein